MRIEEHVSTADNVGVAHYFTAVLFEGWPFWTAGPSGTRREQVLAELALYRDVTDVHLVKTYVPRLEGDRQ